MVKSLSAENETLKNKVTILVVKAENYKECVAALDKQMGDLQLKLQKARATTVQEFKDSDENSNELCGYYVEGFDLLRKWMTKHHSDLDLSGLVIGDVEKKLLSDHPSEATAENLMEEAMTVTEVIEEASHIIPTNPTPNKQ